MSPDVFNQGSYSCPTNNSLVGGNTQTWNINLEVLGQKMLNDLWPGLVALEDLQSVISKTNRLNCPIFLDPHDSTFLDVGIWAYYNKRLSLSTIEKNLRYARYMQNHKVSVDFQKLDYQNFRKHMDYREQIENASAHALKHEWKAMRMFLEAYNMPIWPYKPPYAPKNDVRILPDPDTVREFFYFDYSKDPYERALYQYLFYHSFMIGWRVPSEICEMTLDDVILDGNGKGSIVITETKKHRSKRSLQLEEHILSSRSHKSLKNWIDVWRPRVANQYSGNALYLWPSGKPVTVRKLGHKLSEHGKKIWPHFRPYDTRHYCAISRLIETKIKTGSYEPYTVRNWLGHSKLKVTEEYIRHAERYFDSYPRSWIHSALRSHKKRGKRKDLKKRVLSKNKTLLNSSPIKTNKPCRAHSLFKERFWGEFDVFFKLCFNRAFKSITLKRWGCLY